MKRLIVASALALATTTRPISGRMAISSSTLDVVAGTWSIKFTTKLAPVAVTATELTALTAAGTTEDAKGLAVLMNTIKGAAMKLNAKTIFASGNEIWNEVTAYHDQVTFITPQFCKYYGLLNYK